MTENVDAAKCKRCMRCGRLISHYHFLTTKYKRGYACADDRLCYRPDAAELKRKRFSVRKHKKRT